MGIFVDNQEKIRQQEEDQKDIERQELLLNLIADEKAQISNNPSDLSSVNSLSEERKIILLPQFIHFS